MKVCLNCSAENDDDAAQCRSCRAPFPEAQPGPEPEPELEPEPEPEPEGEDGPAGEEDEANVEPSAAAEPDSPAPPVEEFDDGVAEKPGRAAGDEPAASERPAARATTMAFEMPDLSPRARESAEAPRHEQRPPDPPRQEPGAGGPDAADPAPPLTLEKWLEKIEESRNLTIGVIGFATSGKTFFIARLKQFVLKNGYFTPDPPPPPDGSVVHGTRAIEPHDFEVMRQPGARKPGEPDRARFEDFHVIDIPGEQFRRAVEAFLQGHDSDTLIRVLNLSHALIIVLPADDVFARHATEEEREQFETLEASQDAKKAALERQEAALEKTEGDPQRRALSRQINALRRELAALEKEMEPLEHVKAQRRTEFLLSSVSSISNLARQLKDDPDKRTELAKELLEGPRDAAAAYWSPPAYVALAKADLLVESPPKAWPHLKQPRDLELDPASAFRIHRSELYERITGSFPWHKFDFLTCFRKQPPKDLSIRYWRSSYGVGEILEWIHWVRDFSRETGRRRPRGWRGWIPDLVRFFHVAAVALALWLIGIGPVWAVLFAALLVAARWLFRDRLSLVRLLGRIREEGAVTDPERIGLRRRSRADDDEDAFLVPLKRWSAAVVERIFGEAPNRRVAARRRLLRLAGILGSGLFVAVAGLWLVFGLFREIEPSPRGYKLGLEPIYAAEIQRMEGDVEGFREGFVERRVGRWLAIPDDGGWFHFAPGDSAARNALDRAMQLLPDRSEPGQLDSQVATNVRETLGTAATESPGDARGANNYHQGLVALLSSEPEPGSAIQAFNLGFDEIQSRLNNPSPGASPEANRRYSETTYRLYAAQISILYARGIAEMELQRWPAAADSFERAAVLARAQRSNRIVDPNTVDSFWFTVTTRDRRPMLSLSLVDVWTNMLAARIRQHSAAVQAAASGGEAALREEARVRELLATRVAEAAEHATEASAHPRLAANLIVAAARSGASSPAGADDGSVAMRSQFSVPNAPTTEIGAVAEYAEMLSNADGNQDHASADYWRAVQQWRKAMRGDGEPGVAATTVIDQRLAQESGPERQQLQQWLCGVVESEYRAAAPAQRREITRNYGRYYCGGGQRRYFDAAAPFGFIQGMILALLLAYAVLALWRGFARTKAMYRRLFVPRHRVDRAKKST